MSSIGGRTLSSFSGALDAGTNRARTETFGKEGVDDLGMQKLATKPDPIQVRTCCDVASGTLADAEMAAYLALIATPVTVVDQFAVTWLLVKVADCVAIPSRTLTAWRVTATWTLIPP